ncbi:unnamed protein product [Cochlearia groenlandica]
MGLKILANAEGSRILHSMANRCLETIRTHGILAKNGDNHSMLDVKPQIHDEAERSKIWKLIEISERSQLRTLRLPDRQLQARVCI